MGRKPTYEELEERVKILEKESIEHKRAEEALRESKERYALATRAAMVGVWDWNVQTGKFYLDPNVKAILGYGDEEIPNDLDVWATYVHPDDKQAVMEAFQAHLEGKTPEFVYEHRMLHKEGSVRWILARGTAMRDAQGNAVRVVGADADITLRKRAEEVLEFERAQLLSIFNSINQIIYIADPKTYEILYINDTIKDAFQKSLLGGICYKEFQGLESPCEFCTNEIILKEKNKPYQWEYHNPILNRDYMIIDRIIKWPDGRDVRFEIAIDITELKQAEEALKKRLAYEKMLTDISTQSVLVEDMSRFLDECLEIMGKTLRVSRIYIFELRYESRTADNTFEWVSDGIMPQKDDLQGLPVNLFSWWFEMMKNNQIINYQDIEDIPGEQEKETLRPQNIKSILVVPLFVNNSLYGFIGFDECNYHRKWLDEDVDILKTTAQMITKAIETKQAEDALRESEEKYRILVENANDAIFVMQDQKVKFPNPKAIEMGQNLGVDLEQVPFINYIHPEDREMVIERHKKRIKGEEVPHTYTFRLMDREGEALWAELNALLINWEGKPATLNFLRDITKQKKLEAQLQQARRMEALGTLAGGIAHDFNNLLMGIQGRTSLMLIDTDLPQLHYEELKGIEDIVKSAAGLTKQLLGFARTGKYEVKPADMNELIHKSSQMFGRTKKETKIHTKYQESIWPVEVDRSQIEQVLLNLYVNAWQAMPGGGELYLQTENVIFDESYSKPYKLSPGKYVKISVTDTGVGMDEATQERIFEPFFTTKKMGRGMGLGLASTYGIIKNHDGIINVFSQKGEGTTFDIYLPASEKEVIEEKKLPEAVLKGTETILLVDDEDIIVSIGEKTLKRMGYDVITAKNGKEAIELYKENKARVDIVVLDMIMPEMGGGETYDRLKEINPNVKVLLSSGYSIEGQANEIIKRGCDGFIQKPFRMRLLSRKIREVLDKE